MRRESSWQHETELIWFYDPQIFPFVREVVDYTSRRKPPKSNAYETIIGYCSIPTNPKGQELFRWFVAVLDEYDDYETYPWIPEYEWLDPLTVEPGVEGHKTGRKLTPAQKVEFEKFLGERRAVLDRRRAANRARQRKCRARNKK